MGGNRGTRYTMSEMARERAVPVSDFPARTWLKAAEGPVALPAARSGREGFPGPVPPSGLRDERGLVRRAARLLVGAGQEFALRPMASRPDASVCRIGLTWRASAG